MVRSSTKGIITYKNQIKMDREAPDLSGVYMRSLVKKMSSSKVRNVEATNGVCQGGKVVQDSSQVMNPPLSALQPQQHKKKVRRRLHTSRPYQERLLNMAEARREIVTALKFHRASMKQQQQQQQQQQEPLQVVHQPPLQIQSHPPPELVAELGMNPAKSPIMINPSDGGLMFPSSLDQYHQPWLPSSTYDSSSHMFNSSATVPSISAYDDKSSFSFSLPSQTLGLNLNLQDFSNLSTSTFQTNPSLFTSPSSSSSSPALSSTTTDEIHSAAEYVHSGTLQTDNMGGTGGIMSPYPAMDSEVLKEIKSVGDCYDMVWNDTVNSLTSAWWLKFSNAAESSPEELKQTEDEHMLAQLSELPSWLNPTDSYLQTHLNIACPEDSSPDPSLPCMDIGEIEGIDGDWFA